ncbi:MAG: hypothetical protein IPI49_30165 [Myxococcales bacterium]|jgi:hypothetical protein|nr:hypothetical protein [Myxococcales bacterium]
MKRTLATSLVLSSLFALTATGCLQQDQRPEGLEKALPTSEQLSIKLPESQTRAVGQLAEYYTHTRNITRTLNGSTAWVLVLIHAIVQYPVTTVEGNVYTWGPWGEGLDPAEYKLVVTALANGNFEYQLAGRPRNTTGSFETVISGTAIPGATETTGKGQLLLDFDAAERVNPVDNDGKGQLTIKYDFAQRALEIDAVTAENGRPATAHYAYKDQADGSGDMVFGLRGDAGGGAGLESLTLRSRWQAGGAGRGDARVVGGDVGQAEVTASECWDGQFRRTYFIAASGELGGSEGNVANCVFANADLPPRQ